MLHHPPFGIGMALTLLYLVFAAIVAACTHTLTSIANQSVVAGLLVQAFTYNHTECISHLDTSNMVRR
ncbi:hypothetical protein ACHHYP_20878 [Achlya hypogyna]|uniref:Uncharacterized protein n=1 Tax=Achlya hypogyna TaxID=1202772 RepID=A0A1V9Y3V6_ACHHY|nr:hypothetical protein ACHHYP_20878 [Achlya hypogyna]